MSISKNQFPFLLIILALCLQRAHLAPGSARFAYRAPVRDEIDMERIIKVWGDEPFEDFVRLLARGFLRNPAQTLGDAKYVRVHRKRGCRRGRRR